KAAGSLGTLPTFNATSRSPTSASRSKAVSEENVEAIRRGNAAFSCGDWDTLAANMDQHILIRTDRRWPEQYIYGLEAALTWWQGLSESGGRDARIEEVVDLGDRVLARLRWTIRGQLSGIEG